MANVLIQESQFLTVAATWNRRTAAETLSDPKGMSIARFEFAVPYETNEGRVFDSALVWYNQAGAIELAKRGLKDNIAREAAMLQRMFTERGRGRVVP